MQRFSSEIKSMNTEAEQRFERDPRPMAFPEDMDAPRTFRLSWKPEPVPLKAEERVASMVVKRGDFGWLEDDRVDEIASALEGEAMYLDQALSLRSALLQQKTVYSPTTSSNQKQRNWRAITGLGPPLLTCQKNTISHPSTSFAWCSRPWDGPRNASRRAFAILRA